MSVEQEALAGGTEGGRSPTGVPPAKAGDPDSGVAELALPAVPDPTVPEKPDRRRFTADYKLRVLQEADRCTQSGELGALLRREGLYSSHLANWRQLRDEGTLSGLAKPRGRKPAANAALVAENERLKRHNERLEAKLRQAETIIEVQKKLSEILSIQLPPADNNERMP
jgi:transposase-like protein